MKLAQCEHDQEIYGHPDGAAPIGVPAVKIGARFAGLMIRESLMRS
jgi:hypothetical protein